MHPERSGIANGPPGQPETDGIFLTHPGIEDARFFVRMGARRQSQSVDLWRVDVTDLILEDLTDEGGWWVCRAPIPPERIKLVEVWETPSGSSEPHRQHFLGFLGDRLPAVAGSAADEAARWVANTRGLM